MRSASAKRSRSQVELRRVGFERRQPQAEERIGQRCVAQHLRDVVAFQAIAALLRRATAARDQPAQRAVARPRAREQHETQAAFEPELAAHDEMETRLARGGPRAHDAGDGALVRQRERVVAQIVRTLHQLLRVRGAAQEGEVAEAVQLGVGRSFGIARRIN